jgi:putative N-acetylmannosamine-6-phosphate epimerase
MSDVLRRLRGGLVVSVQAYADSLLNEPATIALIARCAVQNAAVGVRIEGLKRAHEGFEPYITSTREEVALVAAAGASIVAFDATGRPRPDGATLEAMIAAAHAAGVLAMADCATAADLEAATRAGADIIATTLAGYTRETAGRSLPASVPDLRRRHRNARSRTRRLRRRSGRHRRRYGDNERGRTRPPLRKRNPPRHISHRRPDFANCTITSGQLRDRM